MAIKQVIMYTTKWCGDCMRSKQLLSQLGVEYEERDIEKKAEWVAEVERINGGNKSVPTILISGEDGKQRVLVEPSNEQLRSELEVNK